MKKNLHLIALLLALPVTSTGATMDFVQAFEQAQKDDPQILAAEFQYQATQQKIPQARAALLPNVSLDVFKGKHDTESTSVPTSVTTIDSYDTEGYTLSLTQSIYNHGYWLQWQQADLTVAIGEAQVNAARQDLIVRVAQAYYNLLAAQDTLKFATAEKESIGKQLEQNKQRFNVGLIAVTDVKESQAQYDLSVAQWITAENAQATATESLRNLIGIVPENLAPLVEDIPLMIPQPENIDEWVKTALQNNLSLKAAQLALEVAEKQVGVQRSGHYPSLSLIASRDDVTTDGVSVGDTESTDDAVILNLNVPIFSGGLTNARTQEAIALKEQTRVLRDQSQRATEQLCRTSYLGVTASIARVTAYKQALISTQAAFEATQAGYEVGTRTAVEVLTALREQYRSERDYAQARYDYVINLLRLKQAAGMLSREDVVMVNQWLVH